MCLLQAIDYYNVLLKFSVNLLNFLLPPSPWKPDPPKTWQNTVMTFLDPAIKFFRAGFTFLDRFLREELLFLQLFLPTWLLATTITMETNIIIFFSSQLDHVTTRGFQLGSLLRMLLTSIFIGFTSVFDMYGAQFCGRGQSGQLGSFLGRMFCLGFFFLFMMVPIIVGIFYIMQLAAISPDLPQEVKRIAESHVIMTTGLILLDYFIQVFFMFFINQRAMSSAYGCSLILFSVQAVMCYILVVLFKMDILGIVLSEYLSRILVVLMSFIVMVYNRKKWNLQFRKIFHRNIHHNWREIMWIGISGSAVSFFLAMNVTLSALFSQRKGVVVTEVFSSMLSYMCLLYPIGSAAGSTAAVLIGNALGSRDIPKIHTSICITLTNLFLIVTLSLIGALVSRPWFFGLITQNDFSVRSRLMDPRYVTIYTIFIFFLCISRYFSEVLLIFGKPFTVMAISFISACVFGLPLILIFNFCTNLNAAGLLLGLLLESAASAVVFAGKVNGLDLGIEIEECSQRLDRITSVSETNELVLSNPNVVNQISRH